MTTEDQPRCTLCGWPMEQVEQAVALVSGSNRRAERHSQGGDRGDLQSRQRGSEALERAEGSVRLNPKSLRHVRAGRHRRAPLVTG